MKRTPTVPITARQARIVAKLCEILYTDHYHPEVRKGLRAWIRANLKAQEIKRQGYKVSVPFHPGRRQVIVVSSNASNRTSKKK